ncbi:MAG: M23 family metallopeptidase, partial [Candidatus Andersenbacteria bacterium]|nr:M23 family metallopeptidase [Candidatus Andersenbacteria bacterium]
MYPVVNKLVLPVSDYRQSDASRRFGDKIRRRVVLWAVHLGDDVVAPAGTAVRAIGDGEVVFASTLPGSERHRSWGGLVVIGHFTSPPALSSHEERGNFAGGGVGEVFYSLYGHLGELRVREGEVVGAGQQVGVVAAGKTPENGWWQTPHLHFAIYTGPLPARRSLGEGGAGRALPGYWRPDDWLLWRP